MPLVYKGESRRTWKPISREGFDSLMEKFAAARRKWHLQSEVYPSYDELLARPAGSSWAAVHPSTAEIFYFITHTER